MAVGTSVWLVDSSIIDEVLLSNLSGWLSLSEQQRYQNFTRPLRRRQFLVGRLMLREALGSLLGIGAVEVQMVDQRGAAPRLDMPGCETVGFSISHSGPWVACAANLRSKLGLDIEVLDPERNLDELAQQALEAAEIRRWRNGPQANRTRSFYDIWCEKEARFKLLPLSGECTQLFHPQVAIALCSERPMQAKPTLLIHTFPNKNFSL